MDIYIVRHAQSRANVGFPESEPFLDEVAEFEERDSSLTNKGRWQADRLGQRLSQVDFDYIFSGPLHRHLETAYGVVRHQKNCKTVEIIHDLNETGDETWNGLPIDIMRSIFPEMNIIPSPNPTRTGGPYNIPEEEISPQGFLDRAKRMDAFLRNNCERDAKVLLVTSCNYGGCVLVPKLLGVPDDVINNGSIPFDLNNASVTLVTIADDPDLGEILSCGFANDVSHLVASEDTDVSKLTLHNKY